MHHVNKCMLTKNNIWIYLLKFDLHSADNITKWHCYGTQCDISAVENQELNQEFVINQQIATGGVWFFCQGGNQILWWEGRNVQLNERKKVLIIIVIIKMRYFHLLVYKTPGTYTSECIKCQKKTKTFIFFIAHIVTEPKLALNLGLLNP